MDPTAENPFLPFDRTTLAAERVHGGTDILYTAQVRAARPGSGIRFIDMTVLPLGAAIPNHSHALDNEEIYVVLSGSGTMVVNGTERAVNRGDVIVNPPGGCHGLSNTGDTEIELIVIEVSTCNVV